MRKYHANKFHMLHYPYWRQSAFLLFLAQSLSRSLSAFTLFLLSLPFSLSGSLSLSLAHFLPSSCLSFNLVLFPPTLSRLSLPFPCSFRLHCTLLLLSAAIFGLSHENEVHTISICNDIPSLTPVHIRPDYIHRYLSHTLSTQIATWGPGRSTPSDKYFACSDFENMEIQWTETMHCIFIAFDQKLFEKFCKSLHNFCRRDIFFSRNTLIPVYLFILQFSCDSHNSPWIAITWMNIRVSIITTIHKFEAYMLSSITQIPITWTACILHLDCVDMELSVDRCGCKNGFSVFKAIGYTSLDSIVASVFRFSRICYFRFFGGSFTLV